MKTIALYCMILISFVQCKEETDNCHVYINIKNNSNDEIIFSRAALSLNPSECSIQNIQRIRSNTGYKYQPYLYDCIETAINFDKILLPLYIIEPNNYTTEAVPCEEFEERNTILRTYVLTLEDLERMDYTINYPEDASIGVE